MNKLCLCLDGGGARIISSLTFLDEMRIDLRTEIKDMFSVIIGTSAGGILAYGLGFKDFGAEEDLHTSYLEMFLGDLVRLFKYPIHSSNIMTCKYSEDKFLKLFRSIWGLKTQKEVAGNTRVLTTAYNLSTNRIEVFDTENETQRDFSVVDCAMATSALPSILPPHKIGNDYYIDGAVKCSNPLLFCLSKLTEYKDYKVLSLGTGSDHLIIDGKNARSQSWGMLRWIKEGLVDIVTASHDLNDVAENLLGESRCLRLNFQLDANVSIDNVETPNLVNLVKCGKAMYWENAGRIRSFLGRDRPTENKNHNTD